MNKTRLPSRRTFVLDFCGCKIDELFCGYLQFFEILHVYIIGICSQLERKKFTTWEVYSAILKSKERDSDSYLDWKRRLDIDQLASDLRLVLTKDRPSAYYISDKENDACDRWDTASGHVKKFLLASVGNALGKVDKPDRSLIEEPKWFDEMSTKCLMRSMVNILRRTFLKENQNINDYVVEMIDGFDRLEVLGGKIGPKIQQLMILDGLPKSYEKVKKEIMDKLWPTSLLLLSSKLIEVQVQIRKMEGGMVNNSTDLRRKSDMAESSSQPNVIRRKT